MQEDFGECNEEWRSLPRFESAYEVSSHGRVRNSRTGHIKATKIDCNGYEALHLHLNSRSFYVKVHSLVASAFIGPRPAKHDVNHIDGNKGNNTPANLEYLTRSENMLHAMRLGLIRKPPTKVKLSVEKVIYIRRTAAAIGSRRLAKELGISPRTVKDVRSRRTWAHVKEE